MKHLLVALSVCLLASTAYATKQVPENILYKGQEYGLACVPLEKYFDANHPKPAELRATNTACVRGYVGTWEIKDKGLYLKSLGRFGHGRPIQEIPFSLIFKDREPPLKATWYTGVLRMPHGEKIGVIRLIPTSLWDDDLYISVSYGTSHQLYEKDLYLGIVRGNVVSEHLVDNKAEGATRSVCDWGWVTSGSGPIKDDLKWYDLRFVASDAFSQYKKSGKSFRTRGVYHNSEEKMERRLWIPPTLATELSVIMLKSMPENYEPKQWQHVEITAHFEKEATSYSLHVDSIRPLKPGETMHHPDFKPSDKPSE